MQPNDISVAPAPFPPRELEAIKGIGDRFPIPPFRVNGLELPPLVQRIPLKSGRWWTPDATIDLEWEGQLQRFAVEYKSSGTPQQIDFALQQVRRYTLDKPAVAPLIIAPYLRPEILDWLVEERVSGIDLSGNYAVVIPGRWLVVRTGAKNKYPSSAPIKNIYRGKSGLVARALMLKGSFTSATAIMSDLTWFGHVSLPTISKTLKSLEDELLINRGEEIEVVQPDRLLSNLLANYQAPTQALRVTGKIGLTSAVAARINENSLAGGVVYAADSPAQYTVLPSSEQMTRIYTVSINKLLRGIELDSISRFPDVELIETPDISVFYGRQRRGELYWTSPLQVYLELSVSEKREKQAAQQIEADLLAFRYR